MAHKFKKGDSIFFLFKKGKTVQDSQRKPRFYLTRDKAEMYLPFGDEIVEYAPVRHGRWERYCDDKFMGYGADGKIKYRKVYTYECDNCRHGTAIKTNYCPHCGAKMDGDSHAV